MTNARLGQPSGAYPPSSALTSRPLAPGVGAGDQEMGERLEVSTSSVNPPSGSPASESKPAETRIKSGTNPFVAASIALSSEETYSARGNPAGFGMFQIVP